MALVFHKMHGTGNDFVLLDLRHQRFDLDPPGARALADRHTGIGCDQVLVLRAAPEPGVLAAFEVWNADGSQAEHCGNGVRCIGHYLSRCGEGETFRLRGPASSVDLSIETDGQVRAVMGRPEFDPALIPVTLEPRDGWYLLDTPLGRIRVGAVSLGNPHACIATDDLSPGQVRALGSMVAEHPAFPRGCNAGFARIIDRHHVELRVFERGAGPTLACGSGACAAVAVFRKAGLLGREVEILQEGGTLRVEWPRSDEPIVMTGPAVHVFEGTLV